MPIRSAQKSDMPTLVDLIRRSFQDVARRFGLNRENCPTHPSLYTEERMTADFEKGVTYYILENEGVPAGCAALEKASPDLCYLERLGVLPDKRENGFGKSLVEHVFTEAQAFGAKKISIGIIADHRELKSWYAKIGFEEGETREFNHLPFRVTFMEYEL